MFTGFPEETLQYFIDLRYHNSAEWFHANHDRYVRDVQQPFYSLIDTLTPTLQEIEPQLEIRPNKLLSRIRRDTRFTRDKSPYRDHLWIWFHKAAEPREQSIGYWFELGPAGVSWGLAMWGDNRPLMERFRREMAAHPRRVGQIIRGCALEERGIALTGDQLKRIEVPPGIPAWLHAWYHMKEPVLVQTRADFNEIYTDRLAQHVAADFQALTPIYRLLRGIRDELAAEETAEEVTAVVRRRDEW